MHKDALRRLFTALIAVVLAISLYRRYITDSHDPYKCTALLNAGQWLDEPAQRPSRNAFQKWQPPGCLLHEYNAADIGHCAVRRQLLFIGDSSVRQLFWAVAKKLNHHGAIDASKYAQKHGDVQYGDRGVDLRFVWDPYLNGSVLHNELQIYQENIAPDGTGKEGKKEVDAVMIVLGSGLWYARQFETGAVREFKASVDKVVEFTRRLDGSDWKATAPFNGWEGIGDQVFFIPVEDPVYDRLSPARQVTIMPDEVDQMNEYLRTLAPSQGLTIPWVYQVMADGRKYAYEQSGIHVVDPIANRRADVMLNLRCNAKDDNAIGAPYERTCCSKYTSGNWFQWVLVVVSLVALPVAMVLLPRLVRSQDLSIGGEVRTLLPSVAFIGLALSYCFFADRSQLFNKVQKVYYQQELLTLALFALAVGLVTIRKTKDALLRKNSKEVFMAPGPSFMSRDQTDEWKGWMQVFMLLYHWTAASRQLQLYIIMRLLVGAYLFMTGYGHTMYFYRTGDYSVRRVAAVLIRLNLLTVALSYQMYTNYLFYIFAPLVTFWFLVIYATLRFGAELNNKPSFLVGKIALSASLIALAHNHAQPTDTIFRFILLIFGMNWNAGDWRYHLSLDGFVIYIGMIVALLHIWYAKTQVSPNGYLDHLPSSLLLKAFPYLRFAAIIASVIALPAFWLLVGRSPNEGDYNWWQPIIGFLPVLAYMTLRNSHLLLRDHYSAAFAWLGRCSLETFTLGFHVWTAADSRGVLSIGFFGGGDGSLVRDRWREAVLLAPVLGWVAWNVSVATRELIGSFSKDDGGIWRRVALLFGGLWVLNLATG